MDNNSAQNPKATALAVFAPAKINLTLGVVKKRADSYHDLLSLVAFADIGDEIAIAPAPNFAFSLVGPFAGDFKAADKDASPVGKNLAVRAAYDFATLMGKPMAFSMRLVKNLPLAAGLGGGSADAAAVIRALEIFWAASPAPQDLQKLLRSLGADVPVCYAGESVFMGGVGDVLFPAPGLPCFALVLVNPGMACPTATVFSCFNGPWSPQTEPPAPLPRTHEAWLALIQDTGNALLESAVRVVPEITEVTAAITAQPDCLHAGLSGSGATCFGLFKDRAAAQNAAQKIETMNPGWWVKAGMLMGQRKNNA